MSHHEMARVIVTGGTGLVGKGIEWVVQNKPEVTGNATFIFLSSKDADLRDEASTLACFKKHNPTHVIHLAARVGGLFKNMRSKVLSLTYPLLYPVLARLWHTPGVMVEMMVENLQINNNVLHAANECGVDRCVSMTSTCVFPDKVQYPISEDAIHDGPPHPSNEGYAYAKRMVEVLSRCYNEQHGRNYITVVPTNVFGPHDNFNIDDGHVAPGLMHKCHKAHQTGEDLVVWGTGKPLRQFIFSRDLAELVVWSTLTYTGKDSLMLCPDEEDEISIAQLANTVADAMHFPKEKLKFDTDKADGQYKKTVSNKRLRGLRPDYQFTPFSEAMEITCKWFQDNYDHCRK